MSPANRGSNQAKGYYHGTREGWNWHHAHGAHPCNKCVRWLERDLLSKRLWFIMRYLGNGRWA